LHVSFAMSQKKLYVLKIEINSETDECESVTEEWIYPELSLEVDDLDLVDYFDDEAIKLCEKCTDIGIA
jgi:hypothetical protein